jgi:murein L,D-transpeptidase YcbB/YkuD
VQAQRQFKERTVSFQIDPPTNRKRRQFCFVYLTLAIAAASLGTSPLNATQLTTLAAADATAGPALSIALEKRLTTFGRGIPREEMDALRVFYKVHQHKLLWLDAAGYTSAGQLLRAELGRAEEWGLDASDFRVPSLRLDQPPSPEQQVEAEVSLSLAVLKYARFARGGRTEPLSLSRYLDRKPPVLDPRMVMAAIATSDSPDAYLRSLHPKHPQFHRLREALALANPAPPKNVKRARADHSSSRNSLNRDKILANMEQWRWMPEDLGQRYVWVNIPEYSVRVIKDGREIHNERVVVGNKTTPTPIFSDEMESIVLLPRWNVPDSIKTNELLPHLEVGDFSVLSKQNLRVMLGNREVDPKTLDWRRTDIKKYYFYQPPGGGNALGIMKFLFPNKHDVYLHDTPAKGLFTAKVRAFSHGCIRVRHPERLAELLLEDQGWSADQLTEAIRRGPQDNKVSLSKIPVHLTYFTLWVDDGGSVRSFSDVYDHEHRITYGLAGKPHLIRREPEPVPVVARQPSSTTVAAERREPLWESTPAYRNTSGSTDWMKDVFNNR